jgi:hypothetical protein
VSAPLKPVRELTLGQLFAADVYVTEREGEFVYADTVTGREMAPGELVPVPEPDPEAEAEP